MAASTNTRDNIIKSLDSLEEALTTFNTENYKDEYIIARSCHGLVLTQFFNFSGEVEHLQRALMHLMKCWITLQ